MGAVFLRRFPYPYRAALAICSDIDGTKTIDDFLRIQEFLNTTNLTRFGRGAGLEIGNSFFALTLDDRLSYLSSRPQERKLLRNFIRAGFIDCLHSYGLGARTRGAVHGALDALASDGCHLTVWVDHSRAPTNLGEPGGGAVPSSPAYHADLTLAYGVRFAWLGRGTVLVGQSSPVSRAKLTASHDRGHARRSTEGLLREILKIAVARGGSSRYAMHQRNSLMRAHRLPDGNAVYEFIRTYPYWNSKAHANNQTLAYVLRPSTLEELKRSEGVSIIYTHFALPCPTLPPETCAAIQRLAVEHREGRILVTTTSRLLRYWFARQQMRWSYEMLPDNSVRITITSIDDPLFGEREPAVDDLQGITFQVPHQRVSLFLGERELHNPARFVDPVTHDHFVSIPRTELLYPG
jgi:hypothetical protein